MKRNLG